jgi:molybdenum cofactor sulfurtransferase
MWQKRQPQGQFHYPVSFIIRWNHVFLQPLCKLALYHRSNQVHQPSPYLSQLKCTQTHKRNIKDLGADFACVSFYKMFGTPTGLGCLIGRREAFQLLLQHRQTSLHRSPSSLSLDSSLAPEETTHGQRKWGSANVLLPPAPARVASDHRPSAPAGYFGGGTLDSWLPGSNFSRPRESLAVMVDGSEHFRGICALLPGFKELQRVGGVAAIQRHCSSLRTELLRRLRSLVHTGPHSNHWSQTTCRPVIELYDWSDSSSSEAPRVGRVGSLAHRVHQTRRVTPNKEEQLSSSSSSIVAFNVLRPDGSYVGYAEVAKLAGLNTPPIQVHLY